MKERRNPPALAGGAKRRGRALALGAAIAVALAAGIAAVLFTLPSGGKGGGGEGPLELVRRFLEAVEKEDIEAFMSCFCEEFPIPEPEPGFEPLLEGTEIDPRKFLEFSFQDVDFRFEGVELRLVTLEGDYAKATTVSGVLYMNPLGVDKVRDLGLEPLVFEMVRRNGAWYLTGNPVPYIT